jgi:tRNA A37 methylthiotransferase MiaB
MRRFGDGDRFIELIGQIRELAPDAGIRSNFIVGFPGETEADIAELLQFLGDARLDAIGVFGYSDEDGTEAASLPGKLRDDEIAERVDELADLADTLMAERAAARVGATTDVLIEEALPDGRYLGRAEHQAPEVDGATEISGGGRLAVGDLVPALITGNDGVDLRAEPLGARVHTGSPSTRAVADQAAGAR